MEFINYIIPFSLLFLYSMVPRMQECQLRDQNLMHGYLYSFLFSVYQLSTLLHGTPSEYFLATQFILILLLNVENKLMVLIPDILVIYLFWIFVGLIFFILYSLSFFLIYFLNFFLNECFYYYIFLDSSTFFAKRKVYADDSFYFLND